MEFICTRCILHYVCCSGRGNRFWKTVRRTTNRTYRRRYSFRGNPLIKSRSGGRRGGKKTGNCFGIRRRTGAITCREPRASVRWESAGRARAPRIGNEYPPQGEHVFVRARITTLCAVRVFWGEPTDGTVVREREVLVFNWNTPYDDDGVTGEKKEKKICVTSMTIIRPIRRQPSEVRPPRGRQTSTINHRWPRRVAFTSP